MKKALLLTAVSLALALAGPVHAATFEVTSLADSGAGTLRDAVTNANATAGAHTITFQSGLTGTINLDTVLPNLTQPLTIAGPGAAALTVRRNGAGTYGAFYVTAYSTMTNLVVSGLTFKNFNHNNGAIYVLYAQGLTISNCVFDGNASGERAGVFADQLGTATITGCVFTNNSGASSGAALQCNSLTAFTVTDCIFAGNTSSGNGGAFYAAASYYVDTFGSIQRCTFVGNSAAGGGGAASFSGSGSGRYHQYNVSDCTFSGNYGASHSGAILNGSPYLTLKNCTISGNSTGGNAGGVYAGDNNGGYTTFINCTVTANRCGASDNGGNGGGIFAQANTGRAILRNTIVSGNVDSGVFADNPDVFGGFTSQGWNFIGATNGSPDFTNSTDIIGSIAAPAKARLSALGDFGGPTKTHVLMQGSPALDKGNVSGLNLTTDQRGLTRIVDETGYASAVGGDGSDIGSTERFTGTNSPPVIVLDPLDVTLKASSNTVLTAGAIGTEPIAYQWRKSGVPIFGATNNELS
ncbi:MAG: right-handed parallel beta-helix repeat-containing protein, partial [Verrucomicrobia bacterium]|nr:right-handed parallel beta-helix repeat-containing protein [Verrucomicrobiota bacterium]